MRLHPLLLTAAFSLCALATTAPSRAEVVHSDGHASRPKPVVLAMGDVKIFSTATDEVRPDEVRQEAMSALATLDLSSLPASSRNVVSVTLVRVAPTAERPEPSCVVTALVRDTRKESLVATVEARARAPLGTTGNASAEEKRAMMKSAVRAAITQLPTALK